MRVRFAERQAVASTKIGPGRLDDSPWPPNGSRLSCGALRKDSFLNQTRAASFRRLLGSPRPKTFPDSATSPGSNQTCRTSPDKTAPLPCDLRRSSVYDHPEFG